MNFHQSTWKCQNWEFGGIPFVQIRKYMNWTFTEELCVITRKNDEKFGKEFTSKLTWGIWQILTQALKNLKNFHFNGHLLRKLYIVWAKKVQRAYLLWHWKVMQNLRKTDLWFGKWQEEFGNFSPEHSKVSKLGLWWNPFIQSRKCTGLKLTEKNEEWCKIWRGIDLLFQNWHKEFDKFWPEH